MTSLPRVVAFDGDDTLWHNETIFSMTQDRFRALVTAHVDMPAQDIDARLLDIERRNLAVYGYGIKSFTLSMIETALEVTEGRVPAADIEAILSFGRTMLQHPVELIDGAADVLEVLKGRDHEIWLVTKGDLFDQESKIARSGLTAKFDRIEIVSEKDEASYRRLLIRHGVAPEEFAMIGNSVRSDILPVTAIGARAFHVPYHVTWAHEAVEPGEIPRAVTLTGLSALIDLPSERL